ncbi:hypothetical protein NL676_022723 [Syzygium grande]|nr:hypothetical protein NL676_022723 [Syzygium grande]
MAEAGPDNCRITGRARSLLGKLQKQEKKGDLEELAETSRTARLVLDMLEAVVATGETGASEDVCWTSLRLQVVVGGGGRFGSLASASLLQGRDGARGCA